MKCLLAILISVVSLVVANAKAEIESIMLAGIVKSYDQKGVVCEVHGKKIKLDRSMIKQKKFISGDVVLIEIPHDRFDVLRTPASVKSIEK